MLVSWASHNEYQTGRLRQQTFVSHGLEAGGPGSGCLQGWFPLVIREVSVWASLPGWQTAAPHGLHVASTLCTPPTPTPASLWASRSPLFKDTSHSGEGPALGPHFKLIASLNTCLQIQLHPDALGESGSHSVNLVGAGHNSAPSTQPPKRTGSLDLGDLAVVLSGIALTSREAVQLLRCLLAVSDSTACRYKTFAHYSIALAFPHCLGILHLF